MIVSNEMRTSGRARFKKFLLFLLFNRKKPKRRETASSQSLERLHIRFGYHNVGIIAICARRLEPMGIILFFIDNFISLFALDLMTN
jgi:hypothetical protein